MFKEEKTIRGELIKANRLEEVVAEVSKIFLKDYSDLPVRVHYDHNHKPVNYVKTIDAVAGALVYLQKIYAKKNALELSEDELKALDSFNMYVESELEMYLHNYAISCAHRAQPTEEELEHIRVLCILNNSIYYLTMELFKEEDCSFWDIPEGWKKK